jgi:DNA-binding SARP family transcriptional activator
LLREFLEGQLARESSVGDLAAIHLRVAQAAEPEEWLVSCRHYLAGGDQTSAVRLLDRSVLTAVGTGAWGQAAEIVAALKGATAAPDVEVILAMEEIEVGRLADAISRLEAIDRQSLSPQARALVRHALLRAHWMNGDLGRGEAIVQEILRDAGAPQLFRNLAGAHRLIATPDGNQDLVEMIDTLKHLARQHEDAELPFFAGVSYYNLSLALYQHADYGRAVTAGQRALELFEQTGRRSEIPSAAAVLAICTAELSRRGESAEYAALVEPSDASQDPDAIAQLAYLALTTGGIEAPLLIRRLPELEGSRRASPTARTESNIVRAFAHVALQDRNLSVTPRDDVAHYTVGIGSYVYALAVKALSQHASGDISAAFETLLKAMDAATTSQNRHWVTRLEVVYAALTEDVFRLQQAMSRASEVGELALLDVAEVIVDSLELLQPLPHTLRTSITSWPTRWLPVVRRKVASGYSATSHAAAKTLDEYGDASDIPLLRAYDRTYLRGTRLVGLGRKLIADRSPVVAIHDLGRGSLAVNDRSTTFGSMRRRAAGLLCYLASRPARSATREQIMEDLWSDLAPASAANSLNQTLYFLRRDLDPHFDEDTSYEYIGHSGDLVWLDKPKVVIDSVSFDTSATAALSVVDVEPGPAIAALELYLGRFAIEFEYEEWSMGWRDYLHSTFLHLARSAHRALAARGDLGLALTIAHRALSEDPQASEIERALVWTYAAVNSHDAATRQYQHYAASFRELHDEVAPSFEEVVTSQVLPAFEP